MVGDDVVMTFDPEDRRRAVLTEPASLVLVSFIPSLMRRRLRAYELVVPSSVVRAVAMRL